MAHTPTAETRTTVKNGAGIGLPHEMIAGLLGITDKTLRKKYRHELDTGKASATVGVLQSLYKQCLAGNMTAIIWYTKTQLGWKEPKDPVVLTVPKGEPLPLTYVPAGPQLLQDYYAKIAQSTAAVDADPAVVGAVGSDGPPGEEPGGGEDAGPR